MNGLAMRRLPAVIIILMVIGAMLMAGCGDKNDSAPETPVIEESTPSTPPANVSATICYAQNRCEDCMDQPGCLWVSDDDSGGVCRPFDEIENPENASFGCW